MAHNHISVDPKVMCGKPVIAGTRLTVEFILRQLANGRTVDQVANDYHGITEKDVLAVLDYAADHMTAADTAAA